MSTAKLFPAVVFICFFSSRAVLYPVILMSETYDEKSLMKLKYTLSDYSNCLIFQNFNLSFALI